MPSPGASRTPGRGVPTSGRLTKLNRGDLARATPAEGCFGGDAGVRAEKHHRGGGPAAHRAITPHIDPQDAARRETSRSSPGPGGSTSPARRWASTSGLDDQRSDRRTTAVKVPESSQGRGAEGIMGGNESSSGFRYYSSPSRKPRRCLNCDVQPCSRASCAPNAHACDRHLCPDDLHQIHRQRREKEMRTADHARRLKTTRNLYSGADIKTGRVR